MKVFSGDILQAVQQGALVLTVNKRLAKHLRQQYDVRLLAGGRGAWRSPDIFAFDSWMNRVAVQLGLDGRLLDQGQELRLWETVVEEDLASSGNLLMRPADAARQALTRAIPFIDKAATKGVIHKATASRKISRLNKLINTLS